MVCLGVEDIPKLHEDEDGEEQRKLLGSKIAPDMMEIEIVHKIITNRELRHRVDMAVHELLDESEQNGHKE